MIMVMMIMIRMMIIMMIIIIILSPGPRESVGVQGLELLLSPQVNILQIEKQDQKSDRSALI